MEELAQFGYEVIGSQGGRNDKAFRALMRFRCSGRAACSRSAWPSSIAAGTGSGGVFGTGQDLSALLDEIERRDYDVFTGRVSLSNWKKFRFVLSALPVALGSAMKRRPQRSTPHGEHRPVMLDEVLHLGALQPAQVVVDCTVGLLGMRRHCWNKLDRVAC